MYLTERKINMVNESLKHLLSGFFFFRMESFESLEDEALLAMVDKYCSQPVHNAFESNARKFDATVINEKVRLTLIFSLILLFLQ